MDPLSLAGVATAVGIIKDIAALARDGKTQEVGQRVIELQSAMLDLQAQMTELLEENRSLKACLNDKRRQDELEADIEFEPDGQFYVRKSERDTNLVRYCPVCWGTDRKLVPLTPYKYPGVFRCAIHESCYSTKVYEEWQAKQPKQPRVVRMGWFDRG